MTDDRPRYMISVAAELVGMHQQTLRMYEAKGLVRPQRTAGNTRLYSEVDLERLRVIQRLTTELGLNLAGVEHVLRLEDELRRMQARDEPTRARATRGDPDRSPHLQARDRPLPAAPAPRQEVTHGLPEAHDQSSGGDCCRAGARAALGPSRALSRAPAAGAARPGAAAEARPGPRRAALRDRGEAGGEADRAGRHAAAGGRRRVHARARPRLRRDGQARRRVRRGAAPSAGPRRRPA